jgi:hypothetical protein
MAGSTEIGAADAASVTSGTAWTLTFNASATNALVQDVARALTFSNSSDTPGTVAREVTFTAMDNHAASTSVVQGIAVTAVNDAPTLTGFISPVVTGTTNSEVAISFADLAAQGDEADVDGTVGAFVIKSVSSGTLRIGTSAIDAQAWSAGTNDTVDAQHQAYWIGAQNAYGLLNAFTAVAKDNLGLESTTAQQVDVNIPVFNLTTIQTATGYDVEIRATAASTQVNNIKINFQYDTTSANLVLVNGNAAVASKALTGFWSVSNMIAPGLVEMAAISTNSLDISAGELLYTIKFAYTNGTNAFAGELLSGTALKLDYTAIGLGILPGLNIADTTIPVVSSFAPGVGTVIASVGSNIVLTFSEAVQLGAGRIEIHRGSFEGQLVESYDTASPGSHLSVSDKVLTIDPSANLSAGGIHYFVTFTEGSIKDIAGNSFAGTTGYDFTTPNVAPTLTHFASAVDAVAQDTEVELSFAELQAQGGAADSDGTIDAFVIKAISSGTLRIGHDANAATAYNSETNNTVDATHHAYWTSDSLATGMLHAFTAVAKDNGGAESGTAIQASVAVVAANDVSGTVKFWKTGAGVTDVSSTLSAAPVPLGTHPVELRNMQLAADGTRTIEIWETTAQSGVSSLKLEFTVPTGSVATWQDASGLPSGWTSSANSGAPGHFSLSGSGASLSAGSVKLGTISLTPPIDPLHVKVLLSTAQLGNDTVPTLGMSADSVTTGLDGLYHHLDITDGTYALTNARVSGTSESLAITTDDALAALKMAVALNPNADSSPVSSYQFLAADINRDGFVNPDDALGILKAAVKLGAPHVKDWLFVPDTVVGEAMSRSHVVWPADSVPVTLDAYHEVHLTGIVQGDVDGSWAA